MNEMKVLIKNIRFLRTTLVGFSVYRIVLWGYVAIFYQSFINWKILYNKLGE